MLRKTYPLILIIILFTKISFSQTGWILQNTNTTTGLYWCSFINCNTGWIVGDSGIILNTINGGSTWVKKIYGSNRVLYSVYFVNTLTGYVTGYPITAPSTGFLGKTTNGGLNWFETPISYRGYLLYAINNSDTILLGTTTNLMLSTDEGLSWNTVINGRAFEGVYFVNPNTGFACGYIMNNGTIIYKSTDKGITWSNIFYISGNQLLVSIYFVNNSSGYAVGANSSSYRTTDGGTTWSQFNTGFNINFRKVFFSDINTGWIVGFNDKIIVTTNSGYNWNAQQTPTIGIDYSDAMFLNGNTGYVAGMSGTILKTTNGGGLIGIKPISSQVPNNFHLYQNYPNPFNPSTKIKFSLPLPSKGGEMQITLKIYDVLGKEIASLIPPLWGGQEGLSPGTYEVEFNASNYPSGVYFYKLTAGDFSDTKRMILLK